MFSGLDVPSHGAHLIRAPGFQTSRIPLRLQDRCASRHRHASLSHRRHLGGMSLAGGLLHHLPKITRAGHLCASHTASMVSSEGKKPPSVSKQPPVPKHYRVLKILGLVVRSLIFLASCKCVANASVQKASIILTFYMRWLALAFCSLSVILHRYSPKQAAAGSISFTLATSDVITVATVVIIPLVVWFVRTLFGKIDRVAEDMAELIKFMHRSEVTTVKDVAASESRTNRIIHLALAGKHPSTDAESASDNP